MAHNFHFEDGLYYWDDINHTGLIWITDDMVNKYNLINIERLEEFYDEDDLEEMREGFTGNFTHLIHIHHCVDVSKGNTDEDYRKCVQDTPHGKVYDEEFVSWWNEFPIELLKEDEKDVLVLGWCDG